MIVVIYVFVQSLLKGEAVKEGDHCCVMQLLQNYCFNVLLVKAWHCNTSAILEIHNFVENNNRYDTMELLEKHKALI